MPQSYQQGFQSHLGNALDAVSGDLGSVAAYKANQESEQQKQSFEAQQNAAHMAFQNALTSRQMAMEENHFTRKEAGDEADKKQEFDYKNKALAEDTSYHNAALGEESKYHAQALGLDSQRVGLEASRVGLEKAKATTDHTDMVNARTAATIGSQLTTNSRAYDATARRMDMEIKIANANALIDPQKAAAETAAIQRKYAPLFSQLESERKVHTQRYAQLTGEEFNDTTPGAGAGAGSSLAPDPGVGTPSTDPSTDPSAGGTSPALPGSPQAGASPTAPTGPTPSPASIAALRANPSLQAQFEQAYGAGSASQYLSGSGY